MSALRASIRQSGIQLVDVQPHGLELHFESGDAVFRGFELLLQIGYPLVGGLIFRHFGIVFRKLRLPFIF